MRRRDFITLLGSLATAWPFAARPQQVRMPVIGFLHPLSLDQYADRVRAFHQGLGEAGYVEGRNVAVEYRWAEGHNDRLPALAADLVRLQVAVIVAPGSALAALAAKTLTTTIPIVFSTGADPVKEGLVASLNRPGGNLTGSSSLGVEIASKQLQLLHEVTPAAGAMALLLDPTNPAIAEPTESEVRAAARTLGLELHVLNASNDGEIEMAFAAFRRLRPGGLVVSPAFLFSNRVQQLAALALRDGVPAIHQFREFAAAGGLISYGADPLDALRLAGIYTGRILKGEKPADLPVERATRVEMVINLKTAKTLGITFPTALLVRADEIIE